MLTGMNDSGEYLFENSTSSSNDGETEELMHSEESSFSSYVNN